MQWLQDGHLATNEVNDSGGRVACFCFCRPKMAGNVVVDVAPAPESCQHQRILRCKSPNTFACWSRRSDSWVWCHVPVLNNDQLKLFEAATRRYRDRWSPSTVCTNAYIHCFERENHWYSVGSIVLWVPANPISTPVEPVPFLSSTVAQGVGTAFAGMGRPVQDCPVHIRRRRIQAAKRPNRQATMPVRNISVC